MKTIRNRPQLLLGNGAIARGIIEAGCEFATSYPGTPATEILQEVVRFKKELKLDIYTEWSINEKVAYDIAYSASILGKRSAVSMKQVGLNVASDTFLNSAYMGVVGGMVVIPCDDPGPHSSQTEQDSRLFSLFAKIPCLDPSSPKEAKEMVKYAFDLSEQFQIPVVVRPTTRICHTREPIEFEAPVKIKREAVFTKDMRWTATPRMRAVLHQKLNEKIAKIKEEFEKSIFNYLIEAKGNIGIISSGHAFSVLCDVLKEINISVPILKIGTPFPFPNKIVENFLSKHEKIIVVEETGPVIELQLNCRKNVLGRLNGFIPNHGEILPDVILDILKSSEIYKTSKTTVPLAVEIKSLPPRLCAGCGHRPMFFAIKKAIPNGIYTSDIGCYTLGMNLKAVDIFVDMGAGVTMATGFYQTFKKESKDIPIVATIGDSTFFHAAIPALIDAHTNDARFVLVILDNGTVAMTGWQPTPASGFQADGRKVPSTSIKEIVKGIGIKFVEKVNSYDVPKAMKTLKRAYEHTKKADGGLAVIIANSPCVLYETTGLTKVPVEVTDDCNKCLVCIKFFECPALVLTDKKVEIDRNLCTDCGICVYSCPKNAIKKIHKRNK